MTRVKWKLVDWQPTQVKHFSWIQVNLQSTNHNSSRRLFFYFLFYFYFFYFLFYLFLFYLFLFSFIFYFLFFRTVKTHTHIYIYIFFFIYLFFRDIFYLFFFYFSEKTSLDISCELSAWQMIHMKCQDLFSLKNNNKKKKNGMSSVTNFGWHFKG